MVTHDCKSDLPQINDCNSKKSHRCEYCGKSFSLMGGFNKAPESKNLTSPLMHMLVGNSPKI